MKRAFIYQNNKKMNKWMSRHLEKEKTPRKAFN